MEHNHHYSGLSDAQVVESRKKHGANILTPPEKETLWDKFKGCFSFWLVRILIITLVGSVIGFALWTAAPAGIWAGTIILGVLLLVTLAVAFFGGLEDPLITILMYALLLSGGISFYQVIWAGEGFSAYFEPIGIAVAVILATAVAFFLELSNEKTFQSLNDVNDETLVKVIRNNNVCQVPRKDIVVGDIVILETGEEVPADCKLLECLNLTMNESSLTGEPQCHKTTKEEEFDKDATYPSNHIMKGCTVIEGYCTAEVFAVGDATACGKVFEAAQVQEGDPTPLSEKLDWLADMITKVSYGIAAAIIVGRLIVYFVNGNADFAATDGIIDFVKYVLDTIMIAVTLIVVAVPEGLPMSVTLSLAFSMRRLMDQKTLPRTMHACETMGATSVICTDKTGTLTQNQMQVYDTNFSVLQGQMLGNNEDANLIKECIAVNTTANLDFADPAKVKAIGNPTEGALLLWLNKNGENYLTIREKAEIVDRLPFSTELKYMATIVKSAVLGKKVLYVKGAPEIVMALTDVSDSDKAQYDAKLLEYQNKAMRTLGFAYLPLEDNADVFFEGKLNVNGLKMMGIVAISDPVRLDVPNAIQECINAGIQVKIVTGDTPGTAKEIGRQVGLWTDADTDENILLGQDIASMTDDELKAKLPIVKIISRARPNDKERAVRILKSLDYVVAVTGDGTNDAPALNVADVGLSMGDGTAVAKEASDMTILDNSFSTITNAVMWGRSLYKNIQRFILFQMTINVVACLIVLIGAFIGTESPLTVTQMLWVNLIMDTFAALALASLPPTKTVMQEKPRSVNDSIISKPMAKRIFGVGGFFTLLLLGFLLFLQHADVTSLTNFDLTWGSYNGLSSYELGLFFTSFVMLQFWNMFNAKSFMTGKSAFKGLNFKDTKWFILIALVIFIGQIIIVQFGGEMFNVAKGGISVMDWVIIVAVSSLVLWVGELIRLVSKK